MMSAFLPLNWKRINKFIVFNISSAFHHIISDIIIGMKVIIHLLGDSIILLRLLNSCLHPSPLWRSQTTRRSSIQAEILRFIKPKQNLSHPQGMSGPNIGSIHWNITRLFGNFLNPNPHVFWMLFTKWQKGIGQKLSNNYNIWNLSVTF